MPQNYIYFKQSPICKKYQIQQNPNPKISCMNKWKIWRFLFSTKTVSYCAKVNRKLKPKFVFEVGNDNDVNGLLITLS